MAPNTLLSRMRVGQNALSLSLGYICPSAASVQCSGEIKMAAPVDNVSERCLDVCHLSTPQIRDLRSADHKTRRIHLPRGV